MKPPVITRESRCSANALVEFLDGELTADREREVAAHIAACRTCQVQLNQQKELLAGLDDSFKDGPEIPADFSKIVSANAKSQITGVRRPYERKRAILISLVLLSIIALAVAIVPYNSFFGPTLILDKLTAVVSMVFGLLSDLLLGVGIVGRAISTSLGISPFVVFGLVVGTVVVIAVRRNQRPARVPGAGRTSK